MVEGCKATTQLLQRVAGVYNWLDSQIRRHSNLAGHCDACGKCCDFKGPAPASEQGFDHRLFITTPEMIYFAANVGAENIKLMTTNRGSTLSTTLKTGLLTTRCPYNVDGKCSIYKFRFAGCRIFCCKGDAEFQSRLSEWAVKEFKSLCTEFQIPYRYIDLPTALNNSFAG